MKIKLNPEMPNYVAASAVFGSDSNAHRPHSGAGLQFTYGRDIAALNLGDEEGPYRHRLLASAEGQAGFLTSDGDAPGQSATTGVLRVGSALGLSNDISLGVVRADALAGLDVTHAAPYVGGRLSLQFINLPAALLGLGTFLNGAFVQVDTIPTESLGDNLRGSFGLNASF